MASTNLMTGGAPTANEVIGITTITGIIIGLAVLGATIMAVGGLAVVADPDCSAICGNST
jgi:hypothetical protein